jgi:hypothetical protein
MKARLLAAMMLAASPSVTAIPPEPNEAGLRTPFDLNTRDRAGSRKFLSKDKKRAKAKAARQARKAGR